MSSGVQRMPEELRMSRDDLQRAKETSRWAVEVEKWEENCSGMSPVALRRPGNSDNKVDGVSFSVNVDQDMFPGQDEVGFRIEIPGNYPNSLPKIYPAGWNLVWNRGNHTFRDAPSKGSTVHICTMFENQWTREGSIAGLMCLTAIWYHKYLHWKLTKEWPGKGQSHCTSCGRPNVECNC